MTDKPTVLICSCEDTMQLDAARIGAGCKGRVLGAARHLCRSELSRFRAAAKGPGRLTIACTQEAPLFQYTAAAEGLAAELTFVNIRETAGWSSEGGKAAPKMAALLAAAAVLDPPPTAVSLESDGVALIWGRGQPAIEVAERLRDQLDLTVLLAEAGDAVPLRRAEYPVRRGHIRAVKGHLGAFEITIDGFAEPAASSRGRYAFGPGRDSLVSKADILIDITGGPALVPAAHLRDGYLRADPASPTEVERLIARAADLVGTFDKPRYIAFREELCAHSRSRITGCTRCLDLCPAGAIAPAGDHVAIDPHLCGGCGECAAACPTGAASYTMPRVEQLIARLRLLLGAYREAGGAGAVLLLHDREHGEPLIDAAACFGDGLPAHILPLSVNAVGQIGLEAIASAFAYGAAGLVVLTRAKPRHELAGLGLTIATANAVLTALGYGAAPTAVIATDDPDAMIAALRGPLPGHASPRPSQFLGHGDKRDLLKLSLRELHRAAPAPIDDIALPAGAAFGRIRVDTNGCTLCHACVTACPAGALGDAADRPLLKLDESLCVQCGLCRATCPEKVITLEPRLSFPAFEAGWATLKEEEPFCCIRCSKPFGTRSAIERVVAKLEGKHWMYQGEASSRVDLIRMCENCRIEAATNASIDPYGAPARPVPKTTDDYLRERAVRDKEV